MISPLENKAMIRSVYVSKHISIAFVLILSYLFYSEWFILKSEKETFLFIYQVIFTHFMFGYILVFFYIKEKIYFNNEKNMRINDEQK